MRLWPVNVSALTRASYQNHMHVEVSAPWLPGPVLSCLPQLPGNCPELQAKWYGQRLTKALAFTHSNTSIFKYTNSSMHVYTNTKNQVSAHVSVWTAAWATASWHSLCKDNIKGENLVYLPPLKIIQTRSLFSSFFLLLSFLSHPPPSAELGFLLTLALRAAVYEAELMHIQHLL